MCFCLCEVTASLTATVPPPFPTPPLVLVMLVCDVVKYMKKQKNETCCSRNFTTKSANVDEKEVSISGLCLMSLLQSLECCVHVYIVYAYIL